MDLPPELLLGVVIAGYGSFVLWKRKAVIPFGRSGFWNTKPVYTFRMSGITATVFGLGLLFGGIILVLPFGYQFLAGRPLSNDLTALMPTFGLVVMAIGVLSAAVSGILRTAKAAGDEIYKRNQETKKP